MKIVYKLLYFIPLTILSILCFSLDSDVLAQKQNTDNKTIITNQENLMTVFPLPAVNTAHIRLSPNLKNEVDKIEIVNLIGRKIIEQQIIDKNTTEVTFNDLSQLHQGIYMVIARDRFGKIIQSAKLVISR